MSVQAIFAPVFGLVLLAFVLLIWMGQVRIGALRSREAHIRDTALGQPNWPPKALQASNAFNNQFQLPVLFFLVVLIAYLTKLADYVFVVLSWLFVATRFIHAGIHITSNRVNHRFSVYVVGLIILIIMWVMVAVRLFIFAL